MCNTVFEVTDEHFRFVIDKRSKKNRTKLDDFFCEKHAIVALNRYGERIQ